MGEDVSEQLEFVPASFRVIRHLRPKMACICCETIVEAPARSRPIEQEIGKSALRKICTDRHGFPVVEIRFHSR